MIKNLGYDYKILENVDLLEDELALGTYDILFSDANLITENIRQTNDNLVIITAVNSKEEINDLIKEHRG